MNDRFGSTARDFAVDIVTREGGTPEDVQESFADPDLDRIASDHGLATMYWTGSCGT